ALARLGLSELLSVPIGELSLAEQQRVAVARALVRSPGIVVADQPTAHQDADGAAMIAGALDEAATLGAAVLVVGRDPHLVAAADRRAWRQLMVHRGRLVDVTDLITVETELPERARTDDDLGDDVPVEITIETTPAEPSSQGTAVIANIIDFPAAAR